jgi:hypothetical protein
VLVSLGLHWQLVVAPAFPFPSSDREEAVLVRCYMLIALVQFPYMVGAFAIHFLALCCVLYTCPGSWDLA